MSAYDGPRDTFERGFHLPVIAGNDVIKLDGPMRRPRAVACAFILLHSWGIVVPFGRQPRVLEVSLDRNGCDLELCPRGQDETDDVLKRDCLRQSDSEEPRRGGMTVPDGDEHKRGVDNRGDDPNGGREPETSDVGKIERNLGTAEELGIGSGVGNAFLGCANREKAVKLDCFRKKCVEGPFGGEI